MKERRTSKERQTSKMFLFLVLAAGLGGLFKGVFDASPLNLGAFGGILLAAVWNRLDSRSRAYKASLSTGWGRASIETGQKPREGRDDA